MALAAPITDAVDLHFDGDPDCAREQFARSLETHLAGTTAPRPVRATLRLRRDRPTRWTADLSLETAGSRSNRRLTGATCFEVCDAAAFVTAVVVDPAVLARPRPRKPPPTPVPDPFAAPDPAPGPDLTIKPDPPPVLGPTTAADPPAPATFAPGPPPPAPSPTDTPALDPAPDAPAARPRRPRGFVRLGGGVEALGLPWVGPQVALAGGLLGRAWRSELAATYRAPSRVLAADAPGVGAWIRMWTLAARGCGVLRPERLELGLCGGIEAGQAIGEAYGYPGARRDPIPWLAVTLGPTLSWSPRRWFAVWFAPELAIPALRGRFSAAGLGTLYRIHAVSLRLGLGLELRFF